MMHGHMNVKYMTSLLEFAVLIASLVCEIRSSVPRTVLFPVSK
jgi:hypothetical protein